MHASTNMHACINQSINPDNGCILVTIIVISVVIALVPIILLHIGDIFMKPATYQKCAVSYDDLESTR